MEGWLGQRQETKIQGELKTIVTKDMLHTSGPSPDVGTEQILDCRAGKIMIYFLFGQLDAKGSAFSFFRFYPYLSIVSFYDLFCNRES